MATINKNFVVKNGLEVAESLIVANSDTNRVGLGTTNPIFPVDVRDTVALNSDVRVKLDLTNGVTIFVSGTFSSLEPDIITGISTVDIRDRDEITSDSKGYIDSPTTITEIGVSSVRLSKNHLLTSGTDTSSLTIERVYDSGDQGEYLRSRGPNLPPEWIANVDPYVVETASGIYFPTFVDGAGVKQLNINSSRFAFDATSGRVGVNTAIPQYTLDINGDAQLQARLFVSNGSGNPGEILISNGIDKNFWGLPTDLSAGSAQSITAYPTDADQIFNLIYVQENGLTSQSIYQDFGGDLVYNPNLNRLGIGSTAPTQELDVDGSVSVASSVGADEVFANNVSVAQSVTSTEYYGDGSPIVGIVTQIVPSIGINMSATQTSGKGVVTLDAYKPIGRTIFVSMNGNDANTGLAENHPKRTIKGAASVALTGDTIKVFPGSYVEENPIVLNPNVAVEGTELRNCVVTPRYTDLDLFHVNNSCHVTDLSFVGPEMSKTASIIALQPLLGESDDRYFDAARLIRMNLDFISREAVGFLTSGYSGVAGGHLEQDGAKTLELNTEFIAAEAVGFITSTDYKNPPFQVVTAGGVVTDPQNCRDDIRDIVDSWAKDLRANSNTASIGAGNSYYDSDDSLLHITGNDPNGYSVKEATIAAIQHAVGIATFVIDSNDYTGTAGITSYSNKNQNFSYSPIRTPGGCTAVRNKVDTLSGIVTSIVGMGTTAAPVEEQGVRLDPSKCSEDLRKIWRAINFDLTRGGNFKSVSAGKIYFDDNWNLKDGLLQNSNEVDHTIIALDKSFEIARAVVNNSTWGGFRTTNQEGVAAGSSITNADYDSITGILTVTSPNHGLSVDDPVRLSQLVFSCDSGGGVSTAFFPSQSEQQVLNGRYYGDVFHVRRVPNAARFEVNVGPSTIPHTYVGPSGVAEPYTNFQNEYTQVKSLEIQADPATGFNDVISSCQNVISTMDTLSGIVTSIIGIRSDAFVGSSGIVTSFAGNSGYGYTSLADVENAVYDNESGQITLTVPDANVKVGDIIELRDRVFECDSGGGLNTSRQRFPSGKFGFEFYVDKINNDGTFIANVGVSTLSHTYISGGFVVDRFVGITTFAYDAATGIATVTAPGAYVRTGDEVVLRDLEFACAAPHAGVTTTTFPDGTQGFNFTVTGVTTVGSQFTTNVGISTIAHNYVGSGLVKPPYSPGVGPITQGPYVRNCTNFVANSIGMKVDGKAAEPGDKPDIGVTGSMSVDSYTQFNQAGTGVSITNGAYAQLVSIFTICDDTSIYTASGGQCDITNSNSSFGTLGLVSDGVGDATSDSIYRYTGKATTQANIDTDTVVISGVGTIRPYDGQALYFGDLFNTVERIVVNDGGSGYTQPPTVTIDEPANIGIRAEALANITDGKVTSVDIIATGSQYLNPPSVSFSGGGGVGAAATAVLAPTYYTVETATKPVSGISTVVLVQNLLNTVSAGTTVYFNRLSLQIASSHSFEWVGSGNDITLAKPALGGVTVQENEIVKLNGGQIVYTSTNQAGNFQIGDDIVINQLTGTISGRAFNQSLLNTVTPLILGLAK